MTKGRLILIALLAILPVQAQFSLPGDIFEQFFSNSGQPLAGGKLYSYSGGTTTPLATYTDAGGGTPNANPVILDSAGRANVWLDTTKTYKFILQNSAGVTIKTVDGVTAGSGGGGGGGTNYWTLTGSKIANNNGGGTGEVDVGGNLQVGSNLTIVANLKLETQEAFPHVASIRAATSMAGNVAWKWPSADIAGCMISDGSGNLSFDATCTGSPTGSEWTHDGDNNVTLSSGAYTVATLPIKNQTPSTGVTSVTITTGAGNLTADHLLSIVKTTEQNYLDGDGRFGPIRQAGALKPTLAYGTVSDSWTLADDNAVYWTVNASTGEVTYNHLSGGGVQCLHVDNAGKISGTGSDCGSGGGGLPVVDTTSIVYKNGDNTATMRFDLSGYSTGVTRVIRLPDAGFTAAGINIVQTWTANQTYSGHIFFGSDNAIDIGTNTVAARNLFSRAVSGELVSIGTAATNFATHWDWISTGLSLVALRDPGSTNIVTFNQGFIGTRTAGFDATVYPTSGSRDLGTAGNRWSNLYLTGTVLVNSFAGFGNRCIHVDNSGTFSLATTDCSAGGGGGTVSSIATTSPIAGGTITTSGTISCPTCDTTNTAQTITGAKTWQSSQLFAADNTYNIGTSGAAAGIIYSKTLATEDLDIGQPASSFGTNWHIRSPGFPTLNFVAIDGTTMVTLNQGSIGVRSMAVDGTIYPLSSARDLGASGNPWRTLYVNTSLTMNGTQVMDSNRNLTSTFNLSGNMTVTGNLYNRSSAGNGISCSGISDSWMAFDTVGHSLLACFGGNRYKVDLTSY